MSSPLLLLLDGMLSRDQARVDEALRTITGSSTSTQPPPLLEMLSTYLQASPEVAAIPSSHDGSLPLHFAASLGNVQVAELIWRYVSMLYLFVHTACLVKLFQVGNIATEKTEPFSSHSYHIYPSQFPPAASIPNRKGKIPLHYAARKSLMTRMQK
jgi:ankyrin repeat protein